MAKKREFCSLGMGSLEEADQIRERIKFAIGTKDERAKKAFDLIVRTQLRLAREYKKATS